MGLESIYTGEKQVKSFNMKTWKIEEKGIEDDEDFLKLIKKG